MIIFESTPTYIVKQDDLPYDNNVGLTTFSQNQAIRSITANMSNGRLAILNIQEMGHMFIKYFEY